ncbi:MAG: hypothetical protein LBH54_02685 [Clostridiales bacterium]|nr:hypothetical protein [Clostridiales bacterium]
MDTEETKEVKLETRALTESLRGFSSAGFEWSFALYNTRKSRDGLALEWKLCRMRDVAKWTEVLAAYLLEKTAAEKTVAPYSPFLSREVIPALAETDDFIREQLWETLTDIKNGLEYAPENFVNGDVSKPTGYAFYGCQKDAEGKVTKQTLFMRRANPFLSGDKIRLCAARVKEIVTSDTPLLKFAAATDFLLIDGVCYFFSAGIEKDFELKNRNLAVAAKRVGEIANAEIVSDLDKLEAAAFAAKNARKFIDFDKTVLAHVTRLSIVDREEFLLTYGITVDRGGRMDTSDPEQCELIIDLLCGRSCLDALGRLSVGSNIMPRE